MDNKLSLSEWICPILFFKGFPLINTIMFDAGCKNRLLQHFLAQINTCSTSTIFNLTEYPWHYWKFLYITLMWHLLQISSYGGKLSYTTRYEVPQGEADSPVLTIKPDVVIEVLDLSYFVFFLFLTFQYCLLTLWTWTGGYDCLVSRAEN